MLRELLNHFKTSAYYAFIIFGAPWILYFIIIRGQTISDYHFNIDKFGFLLVSLIYWLALYFWWQNKENIRKLNELLDLLLMNENKDDFKYYYDIAKKNQKEGKYYEKKESRAYWFGIR